MGSLFHPVIRNQHPVSFRCLRRNILKLDINFKILDYKDVVNIKVFLRKQYKNPKGDRNLQITVTKFAARGEEREMALKIWSSC
jgi:hypothetical protein